MKEIPQARYLRRGLDGETEEVRYSRPKICRLCTLTKLIPEEDNVCKDCWTLRMMGFAWVTCPFFLFERDSPVLPDGKVPIEACYDCSFREGWTERLGPVCAHPVTVTIIECPGIEVVQCPELSLNGGKSCWVPAFDCKACPWYAGEIISQAGRFTYCGFPCPRSVSQRRMGQDGARETFHSLAGSKALLCDHDIRGC